MPLLEEQLDEFRGTAPARTDGAGNNEAGSRPMQILEPQGRALSRRVSEESIRTDLCEGPLPDTPQPKTSTPGTDLSNAVTDRAELIERLKRGESPKWIPNRHLESLLQQNECRSPPRSPRPSSVSLTSPMLLPPADVSSRNVEVQEQEDIEKRMQEGLKIERPRSALHSGNFTPDNLSPERDRAVENQASLQEDDRGPFRSTSNHWVSTSPPRDFTPFEFDRGVPSHRRDAFKSGTSSLSTSFSSSFAYKTPTSPLVQFETNDDIDLSSPMNSIDIAQTSPPNPRRHTLNLSQSSPFIHSPLPRPLHQSRRDGIGHYQAHQPCRSLTSTPNVSVGVGMQQTPACTQARRPSLSSEASPLQHASMVGSYEESILRGRMSTTPSKPLGFLAQIGVLGLGKCKPSLRCPSHVTLPFSAVFYSYPNTVHGRTRPEDGPSPYVGQIDLENGLPSPDEDQRAKRKLQSRQAERKPGDDEMTLEDGLVDASEAEARKVARTKRRSRSPKAPPGGRYRIPEKGQLQIIIKNQNKTAVKLFLVPYDLAGMEPGTKTFIRQRVYSAGPVIDNVPAMKHSETGHRPILRYLIHLHICCPSKGRFYLYKSIRVVFANRVPDGKEKLRNEVTYPEPRYSPYKPVRVMPTQAGQAGTTSSGLATEQAIRRRSAGFSFARYAPSFGSPSGISSPLPQLGRTLCDLPTFTIPRDMTLVEPIPFRLPTKSLPSDRNEGSDGTVQVKPPESSQASRPSTQDSVTGMIWTGASPSVTYGKLSKGDVGYGGNAFISPQNGSVGATEGLLSKRLRSMSEQRQVDCDGHNEQPES